MSLCFLQDGLVFKHIAGLHSELYAVDSEGRLHVWPWASPAPLPRPHPLEARLQLEDERIKLIDGKFLRASIITESGKVRQSLIVTRMRADTFAFAFLTAGHVGGRDGEGRSQAYGGQGSLFP